MNSTTAARRRAASLIDALQLLLSGVLSAMAVCWPLDQGAVPGYPVWWLQVAAMCVLVFKVEQTRSARQAVWCGMCFATPWLGASIWWLYVAMHTYGGLPSWLTVLAVLLLAGVLSLYYGAAMGVYWRLRQRHAWQAGVLFAAVWTLAELARGTWFTGFGWGAMAYAHADGPIATWAPYIGSYGMGALAVWLSATLVATIAMTWRARLIAAVAIAVMVLAPAHDFTQSAGHLNVALLQGNIPQDEKFDTGTGVPMALHWYADNVRQETAELVIAPETAIPLLPDELPSGYWQQMRDEVNASKAALLTGIPLGSYEKGYTNSVIAMRPGESELWQYDKHHLVPFGEFIPPLFKWFTRMMNIPLGDFNRGALVQAPLSWRGQRIAANICYEDLFGEELGARFRDSAAAPTMFANVSNLGWFGDTIAIDQHLQIARMRTLEFQRPYVAAANTGSTVIIDYQGQVQQALPRLSQGVLRGTVEGRSGATPYAWWVSRFGLWPLWLLCLGIVALAWRSAGRRDAAVG